MASEFLVSTCHISRTGPSRPFDSPRWRGSASFLTASRATSSNTYPTTKTRANGPGTQELNPNRVGSAASSGSRCGLSAPPLNEQHDKHSDPDERDELRQPARDSDAGRRGASPD